MYYAILASAILLFMPVWAKAGEQPAAGQFFVSPAGNDTNLGTSEKPFASLTRARDAVRQVIASGLRGDVRVLLRRGIYGLSEPLVFGPVDSGSEQLAITYAAQPGENVIVSGGRKIGGWKRGEGEIWTAAVPGVAEGKWYFRNLFVNGQASRASTDSQPGCPAELPPTQGRRVDQGLDPFHADGGPGRARGLAQRRRHRGHGRRELGDQPQAGSKASTRKGNRIVLAPPHQSGPDYIFPSAGRWYHLENARELLDQPGEWYLDRKTGTLSYWPRPGEDMARVEVVAPVLQQLLVVQGTPQKPVRNLHFKGLRFEHTDWELPKEGYMGIQASHYGNAEHHVPAAVRLRLGRKLQHRRWDAGPLGRLRRGGGHGLSRESHPRQPRVRCQRQRHPGRRAELRGRSAQGQPRQQQPRSCLRAWSSTARWASGWDLPRARWSLTTSFTTCRTRESRSVGSGTRSPRRARRTGSSTTTSTT